MPSNGKDLESVWSDWMPITGALGITVAELDDHRLSLRMPLDPNRNYQGTVFGGSMAALATLAGWSAVWLMMERDGISATLLVQDSSIRYLHPARSDVMAEVEHPAGTAWQEAVQTHRRHGRARLEVQVMVRDAAGAKVAEFSGRYVLVGET